MERIRVLIAKPGLDGHDRGALVIAQGLRDCGMEVVYSGLRQTPEQIVQTALQEDVSCIGLSSLSGAHLELFPEVVRLLRERQADDILVIGGGIIPEEDIPALHAAGVARVFTPGTQITEVAEFIRQQLQSRRARPQPLWQKLVQRLDHIGIAVPSVASVLPFYNQLLGLPVIAEEELAAQGIRLVFLQAGDIELELLEPLRPDTPVAQFLQKRGPGLHHVAYAVDNIANALAGLQAAGVPLLDEQPRRGARGKWIAFLHPSAAQGVLTELVQHPDEPSPGTGRLEGAPQ
ncbi:MAG: methylmalonyl-CoA epimerase [Alicyclobacillus sp.]|nr:methylmalonyl-CoA epimerase [Alicyclobacillus sp.]